MSVGERHSASRPRRIRSKHRQKPAARVPKDKLMGSLWAKAHVASRSAKLLLETGDTSGAVNRAYYAVFGAARAALVTIRSALAISKRHGTIFRRFDKHLVQERGFDRSFGRPFLVRQRSTRQVADYGEGQVDEPTARKVIGEMANFLAAVEPLLNKVRP